MPEATPTLWKVDEAARYLGIRPKTLYEWVRKGRVPHRKLGFNVRFDPQELRSWAASRSVAESTAASNEDAGRETASGDSVRELCRVAREAAERIRDLETSLDAQLTFPQRRSLQELAQRLEDAADLD